MSGANRSAHIARSGDRRKAEALLDKVQKSKGRRPFNPVQGTSSLENPEQPALREHGFAKGDAPFAMGAGTAFPRKGISRAERTAPRLIARMGDRTQGIALLNEV